MIEVPFSSFSSVWVVWFSRNTIIEGFFKGFGCLIESGCLLGLRGRYIYCIWLGLLLFFNVF